MIRYYGTYSNVSRGKRRKEEHKKDVIGKPEFVEVSPPLVSKELKKRWSYFIRKVYETNPLVCLKWALALPLRLSTTATAFLSEELLSAQDAFK